MRVRGLKLRYFLDSEKELKSHPMRVRGLKPVIIMFGRSRKCVAPHAGAWIETGSNYRVMADQDVAPHAGAWIETWSLCINATTWLSHPMRVRGLKQSWYS